MDAAGKSLSEIFHVRSSPDTTTAASQNQILESIRNGTNAIDDYFLLDRLGETRQGTSLHRLLASNLCTPDALDAFWDHARGALNKDNDSGDVDSMNHSRCDNDQTQSQTQQPPSQPSVRRQNCHGATPLHVAVYRNPLRLEKIIQILLDWDTSEQQLCSSPSSTSHKPLASIPMKCGSYPLHVLAGQNLTINPMALQLLVETDPTVILKEDINGDNALSLLWKNTLRFRWAISIMEGSTYIDYIDDNDMACSWMAITTPSQFMRYSLLLLRHALGKKEDEAVSIHDLCSLPRCPPMLHMMALSPRYNEVFEIQGDIHTLDESGKLPIHHAVQSVAVQYACVPEYLRKEHHKSLVQLLLERYPEAARVKDNAGRLPLHYALENGCLQEQDLMRLVELYPEALKAQDPVSSLYPFMLVAPRGELQQQRCCFSVSSNDSCCTYTTNLCASLGPDSSQDEGAARAQGGSSSHHFMDWKKDHVRISFLLLSLCPEALQYHRCHGGGGVENDDRSKESRAIA